MTALALHVGGRVHAGWTEARVRRSLETVAGSLSATLTERAPGESTPRALRPGQTVEATLDGETVLRGHLDRVAVSYDAESHTIEVAGRDATGDLVDCSAPSSPGEWHDQPLEAIAAAIAAPFGLAVRAAVSTAPHFRRFRIEEGETAFEAIERACRQRALLPASDGAGGLVLTRPGQTRVGVRLERGRNILAAQGESDWTDRYASYRVLGQQPGSDTIDPETAAHVLARATDPAVTRHRPLTLIAEQALDAGEAETRAQWEADVRAARAQRIRVVVQGWRTRGTAGALWAPGQHVRLACDWLGLDADLLVAATEQTLGAAGTVTTLDLAPPAAFSAEPLPDLAPDAPAAPQGAAPPPAEGSGWWSFEGPG